MTIPGLTWLPLIVGPHAKVRNVDQRERQIRKEPVAGAIVHSMGERVGDKPAPAFLNTKGYSAHAFITPDGSILAGVPTSLVAFHAGKSKWKGDEWLNATFLGCEFLVAGDHDWTSFKAAIQTDCYTDAQYLAGGYLFRGWAKEYGFGKAMIAGHSQVSGDDVRGPRQGKLDPGTGFDWKRFWAAFDKAGP